MWTVWTVDKHLLHYPKNRPINKNYQSSILYYYIIIYLYIVYYIYNIIYVYSYKSLH